MDCGSALSLVADTDQPRYELWGETVERARILMQSASQGKTFVSEEIFLALRPRNLHFSTKPMKVSRFRQRLSSINCLELIPSRLSRT